MSAESFPHIQDQTPQPLRHGAQPGYSDMGMSVIGRREQSHDLAVDLHNFGAIALGSEVEVELITGSPAETTELPNPVDRRDMKKAFNMLDLKSGRNVDPLALEAN